MAAMNTNYRCWSSIEMINWIISIDASYEEKYRERLSDWIIENGITGQDIDDLDREDLKNYGVINLNDRKKIYNAIQKLIVNKKRRDSLQIQTDTKDDDITSLSDTNDEKEEDKLTLLSDIQREQLKSDGYCLLDDPLKNEQIVCVVQGYIRSNFSENCMIQDIIQCVINFYHSRYNVDLYVELICTNLSDDDDDDDIEYFLVPKENISLSGVLSARMDSVGNRIEIDTKKVSIENMHRILKYLGHHRGSKPAEIAKPIRSIKMERIVEDIWDAHYINSFSKKAIFQVILAANYLDCPCLLHLGAAKIATLIKGKSPEEIKNILADDTPNQ